MNEPTVVIVGRPNVGKSTLFNRLVGRKLALVDDQPGVTRDRRESDAELLDLSFKIVDTAGYEDEPSASLAGRMRKQTDMAIADADVILFVIDARAGIHPDDQYFANIVRKAGKPVILLANKAEGRKGIDGAYDAFSLGLGDPLPFSAEHGEGIGELHEVLRHYIGIPPDEAEDFDNDADFDRDDGDSTRGSGRSGAKSAKPIRIAVVGRPNAGKSTLINTMLDQDRLLTGPEPGITRDSIGLDWEWSGHAIKVFDTAGLRRRARIDEKLEKLAAGDAIRAVKFADIVIVLLDATIPFEKQDLTIVDLVESEGRALVIALNKWDLIENRSAKLTELRLEADRLLPQIKGVPLVTVSGLAGQGIDRLMDAVVKQEAVWSRRVSTSQLNRWLEGALSAHTPPAVSGRRIKIRYMTQPKSRPPYFAVFGNQLTSLPEAYKRYLVNGLRETFDLPGVPIRISLRTSDNPYAKKKR